MKPEVVVADYGVGNVGSIFNMLQKIGHSALVIKSAEEIGLAAKIILPGVGSFDNAMEKLATTGFGPAIRQAAAAGIPLLGVCLGMQLLMESSEEGQSPGLALLEGTCRRFTRTEGEEPIRVPHMGWNRVKRVKPSRFATSLGTDDRYYFVHSYWVAPKSEGDVLGTTVYGRSFCSAVERENVLGVQFHPEKSHNFGGRLLSEFVSSK